MKKMLVLRHRGQMRKISKGFTLIELLVVVAIIGILAAVGTVAYQGYTSGAKKNATKSNQATVTKFIAAELAKCNMGAANVMLGAEIAAAAADADAGTAATPAKEGAYACDGSGLTVSAAAENALSDFKNTYAPANPAVVASATLVLGQTSVSDNLTTVTIETCFDEIGASGSEACATGDSTSTMKNTVTIE